MFLEFHVRNKKKTNRCIVEYLVALTEGSPCIVALSGALLCIGRIKYNLILLVFCTFKKPTLSDGNKYFTLTTIHGSTEFSFRDLVCPVLHYF
jgi:hypothetical protein